MTNVRFEDRLLRTINRRLCYFGLTASAVIIGLTIAVTILALKRVPPYVVALDQGRIVGYAHIFTANDELAPMVIENQLRQFIYDARTVTGNDAMQDHNIHAVYAIARGQAYQYLDAYYHAAPANDPITARAARRLARSKDHPLHAGAGAQHLPDRMERDLPPT